MKKRQSTKGQFPTTTQFKPMRFKINSQVLARELSFLKAVSCKKGSIPVLQNLSITSENPGTLRITATDLDVTLTCQTQAVIYESGSILVPVAKLLDITRTYPHTAQLSFHGLEQGGARITCEKSTFKLVAPTIDSFPQLPEPNKGAIEVPAHTLASMINSTIFAITQDPSRYALNGAKFELDHTSLRMVTTDGHRLAKSEDTTITAIERQDLLIPQKALAELARICAAHDGPLTFATDEHHAYFHVGSRLLTARLLCGEFPAYETVFPKDNTNSFVADIALFRDTVKRVSLMADERSRSIRLDIRPNKLTISGSHYDSGEATEHLPIDFQGAHTAFAFNYDFLIDALGSIASSEKASLSFKDSQSQVMILPTLPSTIQVSNVIMPMRI